MKQGKLPYIVIEKACDLFARKTGFSYSEMDRFFCYKLNKDISDLSLPASNNRAEYFKSLLLCFSKVDQRQILLELCKASLDMCHGRPAQEDYLTLIKLLNDIEIEDIEERCKAPIKTIIFGGLGPKPEIGFSDLVSNEIKILKNDGQYLVYEQPIDRGDLLWRELALWWQARESDQFTSLRNAEESLYLRLVKCLASEPERLLFESYFRYFHKELKESLPALIPQVFLHYDPLTAKELSGERRLLRERMDFLILLPNNNRIVLEVDGKQHYSKNEIANPKLYAEMVSEDRKLKLKGYEIYRFGGYELQGEYGKNLTKNFLHQLFKKHSITD